MDEGPFILRIRVNPGASRTLVGGIWEGPGANRRLVVRVTAPPEKGKATEAAIRAIGEAFDLPNSAVSIIAGEADRLKTLALDGDKAMLAARLEKLSGDGA